ncbi:DNA internalization-related competence protein ComEC/Rec2 [Lacticigenium naphthae]|uniref:DNA internalization-related competence protein ComEC/Rec2 n=1 Tax=Lacticigenium naphthae TaxID=515351 RepID=UPI00146E5ABF|nr:DNA internalization-related competence protein ComEC/Rec2 [Lacticigenium naphthae]
MALWIFRVLVLREKLVMLVSLLFIFSYGGLAYFTVHHETSNINKDETVFEGYIYQDTVKVDGDLVRFEAELLRPDNKSEKVIIRKKLETSDEKTEWENSMTLDLIEFSGELKYPSEPSNFNQFNYRNFLLSENIYWVLEAQSIQDSHSEGGNLFRMFPIYFSYLREKAISFIDNHFTYPLNNYIQLLFLADRDGFSQETYDYFRYLGIVHLLSISGLHVSLIINNCEHLLLKMGLTKKESGVFLLVILPMFGTITDWGMSVLRSITQTIIQILCLFLPIKLSQMDKWSIALVFVIILNPYNVWKVGFQLSFALSFFLIIMEEAKFLRKNYSISTHFVTSVVLFWAAIPILSYHFFEFSWAAVIVNLVFIPFFSLFIIPVLLLTLVVTIIIPLPIVSQVFQAISLLLIYGMEKIAESLSKIPFLTFNSGRFPPIIMVLLIVISLYLYILLEKGEYKKKRTCFVVSILFLLMFAQKHPFYGEIMMIDVGQGESILLRAPYSREIILIDTGGTIDFPEEEWQNRKEPYSIGKSILIPTLKSVGVSSIDKVILTHSDADHIQALSDLAKEITIKEIIGTSGTLNNEKFLAIKKNFSTQQPIISEVYPEEVLSNISKHIPLTILGPRSVGTGNNSDSLILYGTIGKKDWLFTGDISQIEESILQSSYSQIPVDILKVAHHGSNTSSSKEFVNWIDPEYAWISVGDNNRYGHPHQDVLNILFNQNVKVYQTNESGAIRFTYSFIKSKNKIQTVK